MESAAVCAALADAALAAQLPSLSLSFCLLSPKSAPPLARLLRNSTLTDLELVGCEELVEDAASAAVIADALRANVALTALDVFGASFRRPHVPGAVLLGALTGHPSLQKLSFTGDTWHFGE
jgi:hypothetical protein